jgi:hypothetical protein
LQQAYSGGIEDFDIVDLLPPVTFSALVTFRFTIVLYIDLRWVIASPVR